jgi:hypothetical protein
MTHWINSNSGDYITLDDNGVYTLYLISRYITGPSGWSESGDYLPSESIILTPYQFATIKGFVPIKAKKLFVHRQRPVYAPTLEGGIKGESVRMKLRLSTKSQARDQILKSLGL